MTKYILIGYIGVVLAALAQLILKIGAKNRENSKGLHFLFNVYTVSGYLIMFGVTLLNLYIFRVLDLKYILIFLPSTFILILLFSTIFLKEKLSKANFAAYLFLLVGIIIFNL